MGKSTRNARSVLVLPRKPQSLPAWGFSILGLEMTASTKAKFEGTVQPWGNSLGIGITRAMSDMAQIGRGDTVSIEITENGMVISRKKAVKHLKLPYTEAELLAGMTPLTAYADELPSMLDYEVGE